MDSRYRMSFTIPHSSDTVSFDSPAGRERLEILDVQYPPID